MSHFFTQEYEGRDIDITLNPWAGHRSLYSAFLHIIYNPSPVEYMEWVESAARETWRYIPAIKSHIAEEMTLDRCVQRLRKRVLAESWEAARLETSSKEEKKNNGKTDQEKFRNRVPSFFTSPSLVNMGGLAVTDEPLLHDWHNCRSDSIGEEDDEGGSVKSGQLTPKTTHHLEFGPGWGGMGLRGNHSFTSFNSVGSGLFFIGEQDEENQPSHERSKSPAVESEIPEEYIKTSAMAKFYYRRTAQSQGNLDAGKNEDEDVGTGDMKRAVFERLGSASCMDLSFNGKAM